jgi:hypothetical protein
MKFWSVVVLLLKREQRAGVPSGLYLVVMEWIAAITGDQVGYFGIFGIFLQGEKFWRTVFNMSEMEKPLLTLF